MCAGKPAGGEGERRGRQGKRLARHGEMLARLVPAQFLRPGAGSAHFSRVSSCQPQPAASSRQALLPAAPGESPNAGGTAQACRAGKCSPFPSVVEQRLRFASIWRKGRDRSPAMVTARLINNHWNNLRGVVVDLVIARKF